MCKLKYYLSKITFFLKMLGLSIFIATLFPSFALAARRTENAFPWKTTEISDFPVIKKNVQYLGPLFAQEYKTDIESKETLQVRAIRPLYIEFFDPSKNTRDCYFLYPLFRKHISPLGTRWSIFNIIQKRSEVDDPAQERLRIFPFFSLDPSFSEEESTSKSVFPLKGDLPHSFGKDSISWFLFPFQLKSTKEEETYYSFFWPIFRFRRGPETGGGAFFPIAGHFWRKGHYDHRFLAWPLIFDYKARLNTDNPVRKHGFLPFYTFEKSNNLESLCYAWPFLGYTHKKDPKYDEYRYLWPLWVQGRGQERYINRWAPIFTHSRYKNHEKWWVCWPVFRLKKWEEGNLSIKQSQFLYFLLWSQKQTSLENPSLPAASKNHIWPLVSAWDNGAGTKQFQLFSPLEPFFPHNEVVRKLYSPLFALYRYEHCQDSFYHSFLFNALTFTHSPECNAWNIGPILHYEGSPSNFKLELLKGFLGFKKENGRKIIRFLWLSFGKKG